MAGVRYYNQTGPFWDFIASMEEQGRSHPLFSGAEASRNSNDAEARGAAPPFENAWDQGPWGFPFGPFPHRGRRGGPHHRHPHSHHGPPGPPPPPHPDHDDAAPTTGEERDEPYSSGEGPSEPHGEHPHGEHPHGHPHGPPHGPPRGPPRGHHGPGARGRCGPRRGGRCGGARGGFGGPFDLAELIQSQIFGPLAAAAANATNNTSTPGDANPSSTSPSDFHPEVDVFDAVDRFIVHVSLPGAKKEDVGASWDAETSALRIAGVVYRPGVDEELLKTLALDERRIGAFERVVRLGSRANPAQIDVEGISAKLEDGVLKVEVPKLESGFVDVKKVEIE